MCGIVGYIGKTEASNILISGLKRLEYRGYDSAGICTIENSKLMTTKCKGKVSDLENKISETLKHGGRLIVGGKKPENSMSNKGYYFPPTVIECDNHNLPTAENELFGPVLSVMKFNDEEEVINKMNDNKYGLSSGVYTKDINRGLRVSNAIRAGITFVNTYRLISPSAPFGGMKDSGYGKEAGIESIKDYTRIKTTLFNTSDKPMDDPFTMG